MKYTNNTNFKVVLTYQLENYVFTTVIQSHEELEVDEIISVTPDPDCFNPLKQYNPCF